MKTSRFEIANDRFGPPPRTDVSFTHSDPRVRVVHQRVAQFDFEKALELSVALVEDGRTDPLVLDCLREAHRGLNELYRFALEAPHRVAIRRGSGLSASVMPLDPVYVLVHDFVDDEQTVQEVIAATRLAPPIAMQAMFALVQCRVVELL